MSSLHYQIERLINFALQQQLIQITDIIYIRNQYLELFNLEYKPDLPPVTENLKYPDEILAEIQSLLKFSNPQLSNYLGKTADGINCRIMNVLISKPSDSITKFESIKAAQGAKVALDYWYQQNIASYYIKMQDVQKNKHWHIKTPYGQMELTINLSKPEKDPQQIALLKNQPAKQNDYPKCLLCIENEGFAGNNALAARQNHRLIPLKLNGHDWYFQFSPYVYYDQHSIIIHKDHIPMQVDSNTFKALFDFVDLFPHYFIGSNADIPIVGGSILNHDHYQAGVHIFPLEKAQNRFEFTINKYPNIEASVVNWPLTTLRFIGNRNDLEEIAELVLNKWQDYSQVELDIIANTNGEPHNAITPIVRKQGNELYRLDIILRNNRTDDNYPDGIFHPHPPLHHIKKENIGLIEAMGLAILPGRLDNELNQIKHILANNDIEAVMQLQPPAELYKHRQWLLELFAEHQNFDNTDLNSLLEKEIGDTFIQVLTDCGIFKDTESGLAGLRSFISRHIQGG